jgi:hypothetical protein
VYTNAQPNITSTGTLTGLNVSSSINATSFTSNVATGTAPFVISSTTEVANLNVAQSNFANTANSVAGANVSGQVANSLVAGTVYTNAQPNITSTGSLTGLTVSNATGVVNFTTTANVTLGSVSNLHISGGTNGQLLTTDGSGGLSFTTVSSGSSSQIVNGTSNVNIATSGGNVNVAVGGSNVAWFTTTSSNFAGNLGMTSNTISTSNTELALGSTGDHFGPIYLRMQNRIGQAGPLLDGSLGTQGAIVDLGFKVSGPVLRNIRMETRAGANLTGGPEFQFGIAASPGFYVGDNITIANGTTVSTSTTSGAFQVKGGAGVVGNIYIGGIANVAGNVNASFFVGNGSALTGVVAGAGGSNTQIQYNDAGAINGSAALTFNNTSNLVTAGNITVTGLTNTANLVTVKYNETVVAGGSTGAVTLTPNAAAGSIYNYTLTGNITLNSLANAVAGTNMTIILTQDATGNKTLTSTMKFLGGTKTLSTAGNSIDIMSVFYDGTTYYASLGKGFA